MLELETNRTRAHNSSVLSQPHHHRRLRLRPCMSVCFCYATHIKGLQVKVLIRYVCTRDIHKHGLGTENQSRCPFKYSVSPKFQKTSLELALLFLILEQDSPFSSNFGQTSIPAFSKPSNGGYFESFLFASSLNIEKNLKFLCYWLYLLEELWDILCGIFIKILIKNCILKIII